MEPRNKHSWSVYFMDPIRLVIPTKEIGQLSDLRLLYGRINASSSESFGRAMLLEHLSHSLVLLVKCYC